MIKPPDFKTSSYTPMGEEERKDVIDVLNFTRHTGQYLRDQGYPVNVFDLHLRTNEGLLTDEERKRYSGKLKYLGYKDVYLRNVEKADLVEPPTFLLGPEGAAYKLELLLASILNCFYVDKTDLVIFHTALPDDLLYGSDLIVFNRQSGEVLFALDLTISPDRYLEKIEGRNGLTTLTHALRYDPKTKIPQRSEAAGSFILGGPITTACLHLFIGSRLFSRLEEELRKARPILKDSKRSFVDIQRRFSENPTFQDFFKQLTQGVKSCLEALPLKREGTLKPYLGANILLGFAKNIEARQRDLAAVAVGQFHAAGGKVLDQVRVGVDQVRVAEKRQKAFGAVKNLSEPPIFSDKPADPGNPKDFKRDLDGIEEDYMKPIKFKLKFPVKTITVEGAEAVKVYPAMTIQKTQRYSRECYNFVVRYFISEEEAQQVQEQTRQKIEELRESV